MLQYSMTSIAGAQSTGSEGGEFVETTHELDAPPWLRVETTLMCTARTMREAYDLRLAPLGINLTQASIVAYLHDFGPSTQTAIADHLRLGRAGIGTTIDRLQERDLVERRPDLKDRRVWNVAVSPSGSELAARVLTVDTAFRAELRTGISRSERQALASLMTRLQRNLVSAIASSPSQTNPIPTTANLTTRSTP